GRDPLDEERLELGPDLGLEAHLRVDLEALLDVDEASERDPGVVIAAVGLLRQREPGQPFREERGLIQEPEAGDAQLVDGLRSMGAIGVLAEPEERHVEIVRRPDGVCRYHCGRDQDQMSAARSLLHHLGMVPSNEDRTNWSEAVSLLLLAAVPIVTPLPY